MGAVLTLITVVRPLPRRGRGCHPPPTGVRGEAAGSMPGWQGCTSHQRKRGREGGPSTTGVSSELTGVSSELTGVSSELTGVSSELTGVSSQLTGVSSELAKVSSKLTGVSSELTGVSSELTGVSSELTGVSSELTGVSSEIILARVGPFMGPSRMLPSQSNMTIFSHPLPVLLATI